MGEPRLPGRSPRLGDDALGAGQRREDALHVETRGELIVEIVAVVTTPHLGTDQDVGVQFPGALEYERLPAPAVDAGVQVKRRDTHIKTLPVTVSSCGRL